ncbi:unnamed protein product [Prorocentrum cordatum]|uniref:Uncharacterized protein n=1 Tax=Prorocentrum cordatum TaxID=2364126 RepID=A0ABN9PWR0_9DINO|nr:unnamed protein product [Polarella glacialis]
MEVPHVGLVRLTVGGASGQCLEHTGTGEIVRLPDDMGPDCALAFSGDGFAYLTLPHRRNDRVGEMASDGVSFVVWANNIFTRTYHKTDSGKPFVKKEDGAAVWCKKFSEESSSSGFEHTRGTNKTIHIQVWLYTLPVAGCFMFWSLPCLVLAMLGRYSWPLLKKRVEACKRIALQLGLDASSCMPSTRSLLASARNDIRCGGEGKVRALDLTQSSDDTKLSTTLMLWFLVKSLVSKGKSEPQEAENSRLIMETFFDRYLAHDGAFFTYGPEAAIGEAAIPPRRIVVAGGGVDAGALTILLGHGLAAQFFRRTPTDDHNKAPA